MPLPGVACRPSRYGFASVVALVQALGDFVAVRGRGTKKLLLLLNTKDSYNSGLNTNGKVHTYALKTTSWKETKPSYDVNKSGRMTSGKNLSSSEEDVKVPATIAVGKKQLSSDREEDNFIYEVPGSKINSDVSKIIVQPFNTAISNPDANCLKSSQSFGELIIDPHTSKSQSNGEQVVSINNDHLINESKNTSSTVGPSEFTENINSIISSTLDLDCKKLGTVTLANCAVVTKTDNFGVVTAQDNYMKINDNQISDNEIPMKSSKNELLTIENFEEASSIFTSENDSFTADYVSLAPSVTLPENVGSPKLHDPVISKSKFHDNKPEPSSVIPTKCSEKAEQQTSSNATNGALGSVYTSGARGYTLDSRFIRNRVNSGQCKDSSTLPMTCSVTNGDSSPVRSHQQIYREAGTRRNSANVSKNYTSNCYNGGSPYNPRKSSFSRHLRPCNNYTNFQPTKHNM